MLPLSHPLQLVYILQLKVHVPPPCLPLVFPPSPCYSLSL